LYFVIINSSTEVACLLDELVCLMQMVCS